jgi:hypothetical protein
VRSGNINESTNYVEAEYEYIGDDVYAVELHTYQALKEETCMELSQFATHAEKCFIKGLYKKHFEVIAAYFELVDKKFTVATIEHQKARCRKFSETDGHFKESRK